MRCCDAQRRSGRRGWWPASGCACSGVLLVLLPKCPMCIAAYLALWTGASVAMGMAAHLRLMAVVGFAVSLGVLAVRCVVGMRHRDRI